jgi:hypothetical protein
MKVASITFLFILAFTGTPSALRAQNITVDTSAKIIDISPEIKDVELHLNAVKKIPEYLGGKKAWQNFLRSNINIAVPFSNNAKAGTYQVIIRFIIGSDGKLREVGAETNCGYGMEKEVIRCIQKSPDWIPAEISSGKKVSFTMRTALKFLVKQNDVTVSFQ